MQSTSTFPPPTWGLVLGGGAALAAAHVGVVEVLERLDLDIKIVVGTSAGALMAASYAAGCTAARMRERLGAASWRDFGVFTPNRRLGLLDSGPQHRQIEAIFDGRRIEDLPTTFAAVASDARARRPVVLQTGPLTTALMGSMAVPGLFPPVEREGALLIDGTFTSNVPIWAARELGATRIIAVELRETWNRTRLGRRITASLGVVVDEEPPDVLIRPDTDDARKWSDGDIPRLIEVGRVAAFEALGDLETAALLAGG